MNTGRLRLGMLSILLTVIVICMSVLCLLSYATSMADLRLSQRYANTVRIRYELEKEGRQLLNEAGEGSIIETEIQLEGYKLNIKANKENGETVIDTWSVRKIWQEDESVGDGRFGECALRAQLYRCSHASPRHYQIHGHLLRWREQLVRPHVHV